MSRMMDNLARVLSPESDKADDRPNLHLIRSGIVPSPEAMAAHRIERSTKRTSWIQAAVISAIVLALVVVTLSYLDFMPNQQESITNGIDLNKQAVALIRDNNFAEAESLLRRFVAENPSNKIGRINLAYTLKAQGKFQESEAYYLSVLKRYANDPVTLNNLGVLYSSMRRFDQAELALSKSLDADPSYADARLNLAKTLERSGKVEAALSQYRLYLGNASQMTPMLDRLKERSRKLHSLTAGRKPAEEKL